MQLIATKKYFYQAGGGLAVVVLVIYKRAGLAFLLTLAVTVGFTDAFNHHVLKEIIARPRPCQVLPDIVSAMNCPRNFSFPSNHAAVSFAAATLISRCFRPAAVLVFIFALLIGYSRVYSGVHYPADVLGGALYGSLIGALCYRYIYFRLAKFVKKS